MKLILIITGILVFMESVNVFHWINIADPEKSAFYYEQEQEEEKKAGSETEITKFDKSHHCLTYTLALIFKSRQFAYQHTTGLCMDGHCAPLYQPPDA